MSDRAAPRVFVSYAHDSPAHMDQVLRFAHFLRTRIGLDAHIDRWYENRRQDWTLWAIDHLNNADFILVIASPAYKRRADGTAASDEGRGVQFEAAIIRDNLIRDLRRETERILPVVLPGQSVADIPTFLGGYATTRFEIREFSEKGVAPLLAAITGHGQYPMPKRGPWRDGAATTAAPARLATELMWLAHSDSVYAASARINGMYYEDSVVLRPTSIPAESTGFVDVDLGEAYERLTAVVGVLDDAAEPFQVGHFRLHLDGCPQQEIQAAPGKSATLDVDVTGVRKLRLEMFRRGADLVGGLSDQLTELAWGNPTVA